MAGKPMLILAWDYGVTVPLWTDGGLLPDDPEWLAENLRLSPRLVEKLASNGREMERHAPNGLNLSGRMRAKAGRLTRELENELGDRYAVAHRPW